MNALFFFLFSATIGALAQKYIGYDYLVPILIISTILLFSFTFGATYAEHYNERKNKFRSKLWK
jgi:hypothetical protein